MSDNFSTTGYLIMYTVVCWNCNISPTEALLQSQCYQLYKLWSLLV